MSSAAPKAVFLSYASQDADAARKICETLRGAGVEVWFDADGGLEHGDEWDAKIRRQIKECVLFIPIISDSTQAREEGYFRLEWDLASERARTIASGVPFILPVVIDDTREPAALVPDRFRAVQWMRLPDGVVTAEAQQRLLKLWSHRSGALRHEAGNASHDLSAAPTPVAAQDRTPRQAKLLWIAFGGLAAALALALGLWKQRADRHPPGAIPKATTAATKGDRSSRPEVATLLARVRMLTGKTDIVRTQLDTAVALLEQAAKLDPIDANVWAEWALIDRRYVDEYIDRSPARFDLARRHATQATGLDPASRVARCAQAATMVLLNSDEATKQAAITTLETLANEGTEYPDVLYLLATLKHEPERPEATFGYLERAARFPNWAGRAHFGRAAAYFRARQFQRAEDALDQALQIERAAKFLLWKCYLLAIWQGDMVASKRVIEEVPAQMFGEDYAASARWFVELWSRDYDRALAAMRALPRDFMESSALSGPTGYYKGVALAHAGKTAAAEIEWRSALEVVGRRLNAQPNDRRLLQFKARLLAALGDRAEGEKLWRSTRELFGTEAQSWDDYFISMEFLSDDSAIEQLIDHSKNALPFALAANLRLDPFLDRLRSHPKFVELLATAEADPRLSPKAQTAAKTGNPSGAVRVAEKSIAVLPFVNLGADKGDEYLGDGLTEELLSALSQIKALRVPGRSSCFAFKGKTGEDLYRQIGEKLQVRTVLEGTVRKVGEKLRITAQLINVGDASTLWSKPYDGDMKDILAVQTEVAQRVVEALQVQLGVGEARALAKKPTENAEAHRLYLLGRYHALQWTLSSWQTALGYFERAVKADPNYAMAYCGWSYAYRNQWGILPGRQSWARQRELAEKAVRLEPNVANAHHALGIALANAFDWQAGEKELDLALALNPNLAESHDEKAFIATCFGRFDDAIASTKKAIDLDPLNAVSNWCCGWWSYYARRYDDAMAHASRALELNPNFSPAHWLLGLCLFWRGDTPGAIAALEKANHMDPQPQYLGDIGMILAATGQRAKAETMLGALDEMEGKRYVSPGARVAVYLGLGEKEKALEWLEKASEDQDWTCWYFKVNRIYDPIRAEPRFQALLKKVGLDK